MPPVTSLFDGNKIPHFTLALRALSLAMNGHFYSLQLCGFNCCQFATLFISTPTTPTNCQVLLESQTTASLGHLARLVDRFPWGKIMTSRSEHSARFKVYNLWLKTEHCHHGMINLDVVRVNCHVLIQYCCVRVLNLLIQKLSLSTEHYTPRFPVSYCSVSSQTLHSFNLDFHV